MKGKEKRRKKREESGGPEESGHGSLEGEKPRRKKNGEEKNLGGGVLFDRVEQKMEKIWGKEEKLRESRGPPLPCGGVGL